MKTEVPVSKSESSYITQSRPGIRRSENQDNCLIIEDIYYDLFLVFDGVGGAINGKAGTEMAKNYILTNLAEYSNGDDVKIDDLMFECNKHLTMQTLSELYTTYCAVVVKKRHNCITYSSLGDSRIYLLSDQFIEQITTDDRSLLARNVLTKCLGMSGLEREDFWKQEMFVDADAILLCTDGFYNLLEDNKKKFFDTLNCGDLRKVQVGLENLIRDRNSDDSTYIIVRTNV